MGARKQVRSEMEGPRYWYPKYQQWLTLNEVYYIRQCEAGESKRVSSSTTALPPAEPTPQRVHHT